MLTPDAGSVAARERAETIKSRFSPAGANPDKHEIPRKIVWAITIVVPFIVAVTNWLMVELESCLVSFKFGALRSLLESDGMAAGIFAFMGFCCLCASAAAAFVFVVSPICAGSGIPEAKGYLNGNRIPGMFMPKNFPVRTIGVVLATAASFPIGREGPMVCIGGCVGVNVVDFMARKFFEERVKMSSKVSAVMVHEERFQHARRVGGIFGAAAGIAVAFNAPVGAILYVFEEVTVVSWPAEATFRAFFVTVCASLGSNALLTLMGSDVHRLLIYQDQYHGERDWHWSDLPFLVALAAAAGVLSACFTKLALGVWTRRRSLLPKMQFVPYARVLEAGLYALFVAACLCAVPFFTECMVQGSQIDDHGGEQLGIRAPPSPSPGCPPNGTAAMAPAAAAHGDGGHRRLSPSHLPYSQYNCPVGEYNEVATLLLNTAEGAVKHLFSRNSETLSVGGLLLTLVTYFALAAGMPGLSVPMGMFIPNLLIGAVLGRIMGEMLQTRFSLDVVAHPGVYAMTGSAAMLGGFTRMTIATVVLLLEASNDLSIVVPIMIGAIVSHCVAAMLNTHAYDELLIMKKGVPYLDAEIVHEMDTSNLAAADLCKSMPTPEKARLGVNASANAVKAALDIEGVQVFPVLSGEVCEGLVSRDCLASALAASLEDSPDAVTKSVPEERAQRWSVQTSGSTLSVASEESSTRRSSTRARFWTGHSEQSDMMSIQPNAPSSSSRPARSPRGMPGRAVAKLLASKRQRELEAGRTIMVDRIMDLSPFLVLESIPLTRFHPMFTSAGTQTAVVISHDGRFRGVLTREHLIKAMDHREQHSLPHVQDAIPVIRHDASRVTATQERTHSLPAYLIWSITLLIALLVGVVNNAMLFIDLYAVSWKFSTVQNLMNRHGLAVGVLGLMGIGMMFAFGAACLVSFIAPICAGSGIPEAKSYLNGNYVRDMFQPPNFLVRTLGVVLSTAVGFPIGREGPMVCIGGIIGIGVVHILAKKHVRTELEIGTLQGSRPSLQLFIEEERLAHAKRIGCVIGGASGIAAAFGAPIGAILYMIEEVTVTAWPLELTVRVFAAVVVTVMTSRLLLNVVGSDVHRLLLYEKEFQGLKNWSWIDFPFFVLLSLLGAVGSAFMTRAFVQVWSLRKRKHAEWSRWQPYAKIGEALAYAALCCMIFAAVPAFMPCLELPARGDAPHGPGPLGHAAEPHHRRLSEDGNLEFVRYTCPEGSYSEAATLLLSGPEGAIKYLYSRNSADALDLGSILLALFAYWPLAIGMPGLPVPMGSFVPSLMIGALLGRATGQLIQGIGGIATPGIYAMVGSAAFLGGFTHMTLAIVVLLSEASQDLSLIPPVMLAVCIARTVSKAINHEAYDEQLIMAKNIPFMEPKCLREMEEKTARQLCMKIPDKARLSAISTVELVQEALKQDGIVFFPVLDAEGQCVGLVTRSRLREVMAARARHQDAAMGLAARARMRAKTVKIAAANAVKTAVVSGESRESVEEAPARDDFRIDPRLFRGHAGDDEVEELVPIEKFMDPAPYTLLDDMTASRFYPLFTKVGARAACVLDRRGEFLGILTRAHLIGTAREAHFQRHHGGEEAHASCDGLGARCNEAIGVESVEVDLTPGEAADRRRLRLAGVEDPSRPSTVRSRMWRRVLCLGCVGMH